MSSVSVVESKTTERRSAVTNGNAGSAAIVPDAIAGSSATTACAPLVAGSVFTRPVVGSVPLKRNVTTSGVLELGLTLAAPSGIHFDCACDCGPKIGSKRLQFALGAKLMFASV